MHSNYHITLKSIILKNILNLFKEKKVLKISFVKKRVNNIYLKKIKKLSQMMQRTGM
jgi:hypothetical protein